MIYGYGSTGGDWLRAFCTCWQIERYYTQMFSCDTMGKPMEDQYVHMHSNRLCVVGVAESHPVMQEELANVEFPRNVLENHVSGKKKKGGCFMLPNTVVCVLKCKSGREFTLRSCIRGSLIEFNSRLVKEPGLLTAKVRDAQLTFRYRRVMATTNLLRSRCCSINQTGTLSSFSPRR